VDFPADFDVDAFLAPHREKYGNGEVVAVMTVMGPAAFRGPTSSEYARVKAMAQNPADRFATAKTLCLICVLSPERSVFAAWIEKKPGIPDICDDHIYELAGIDKSAAVKK
jgi:hypothetical protein